VHVRAFLRRTVASPARAFIAAFEAENRNNPKRSVGRPIAIDVDNAPTFLDTSGAGLVPAGQLRLLPLAPCPFRISSQSRRYERRISPLLPAPPAVDIAFLFSSLPGTRTFFSLATFVYSSGSPGKDSRRAVLDLRRAAGLRVFLCPLGAIVLSLSRLPFLSFYLCASSRCPRMGDCLPSFFIRRRTPSDSRERRGSRERNARVNSCFRRRLRFTSRESG